MALEGCSLDSHSDENYYDKISKLSYTNLSVIKVASCVALISLCLIIVSVCVLVSCSFGVTGIVFSVIAALSLFSLLVSCIIIGVIYRRPLVFHPVGVEEDSMPLIHEGEFISTELANPVLALENLLARLESLSSHAEIKPPILDEKEKTIRLLKSSLYMAPSEVVALVKLIEDNSFLVEGISGVGDEGQPSVDFSSDLKPQNFEIDLPAITCNTQSLTNYVRTVVGRQAIIKIGRVIGDGNCFFNSMSDLLAAHDSVIESPDLIRKKCCRWLKSNFRGNPLACHLLYADLVSTLESFYQQYHFKFTLSLETFLKEIILKCLISYFETTDEGVFLPVEEIPYGCQMPRQGTHPVCERLLMTYIKALSKSGVYVGAVMGFAFSQVYKKTVVLYPDHSLLPSVRIVTQNQDVKSSKIKSHLKKLHAAGFAFSKNPEDPLAVGVYRFPLTSVYGAEFLSKNVFGFIRVQGCHFEPVRTQFVRLKSTSDKKNDTSSNSKA